MKIAGIDLGDKPLFLAPMEDVTDPSFRYVCEMFGAEMVYTEFISCDGLIRDAAKTVAKLRLYDTSGRSAFSFTAIRSNRWSRRPVWPRRPDPT